MRQNFKHLLWICVLCMMPLSMFAQNITVTGTICDELGEVVIGAAVQVQNTTSGTVTGVDGTYSITVPSNAVFEVSSMGFQTQIVPVNGRKKIDITLSEDTEALEGTVVIGYGTAKKSDVTGSISSVTGDHLRDIPANDVSYALQGRIAGVEMTQTSSKPGASMQIRIRGQRSLSASNDPLIVLDGIPFNGSLNDISTSDIKSIDILKDAASTAIYGSRGANGVIMITTYKGVEGQDARVSFNTYSMFKKAIKYPIMPSDKYVQMRNMAATYFTTLDEDESIQTDWQDMLYRTAYTRNYDLNVSGGTNSGNYRFGLTYYKDESVIPTQDFDRISLNGSVDQKIGKWFRIGFSTNSSITNRNGNQIDMNQTLTKTPIANPYNADGTMKVRVNLPSDAEQYIITKEVLETLQEQGLYLSEGRQFSSYNTGYVQFNFPWIDGLSYKLNAGLNYRTNKNGSFTAAGVNSNSTSVSSASLSFGENYNWTLENLLTYDKTFASKHHLNVVGLYSVEQTTNHSQGISGREIPNSLFQYYNIGQCDLSNTTVNGGSYSQFGLISYMGRIMYTYADKYMLSAAVRSDASSRLAAGHQWHTYPAVSVGWNINKENFMAGTRNWLDELKLRVGFGETSNQSISPYATLGTLSTSVYNYDQDFATGYYVTSLPNTELGWEYSKTWNFGIDYNMLRGRVRGSIEYYLVNTEDILLDLALPTTSGVSSYTANIGATQNKGFEFSVNASIIETEDWGWDFGLNLYSNHNKLVALADGQTENVANCWFVGYPINCLYDYEYDGLWNEGDPYMDILEPSQMNPATGYKDAIGAIKVKYHGEYNEDGSPKRAINADDRVPISVEPVFQGGFNTMVRYKNLDLSVIGSFQYGGILLSSLQSSHSFMNSLNGRRGNIDCDYWTPDNTDAHYPRPGSLIETENPKYGSVLAQFDGTYAKIRTITLGYNLGRISWFRNQGISNLRLYATAQNPCVLYSKFTRECGLDPEANSTGGGKYSPGPSRIAYIGVNTPNTRNYLIGINLSF